ncbi:dextranase [Patella vulgata]|uniref:dextranase n=1 Tax=Patella vulgata TaxID=6465 RepID=UPI00217F4DCC|nr:dextranase [Patella vulgata]
MSVEFDYDYGSFKSDIVDKLLIFADAPEDDVPDPTDPGVLFYGSEAYNLKGQLQLNDSIRQVYLAPGAFVEGGLRTMSLKPIKISGRGILSGANYPHKDPGFLWSIINVDNGMNHTVEGITMVDPPQFFFRGLGDNNVVRNVKTVGPWTHNTDGVGIGSGGLIEDSFFQTNDDTFKVYNDGLVARRCVVWQGQNGAVFQFGWWVDRLLNNVSIDTIDVIHTDWCTFKGEVCHSSGNDAVMDLAGKTTLLNTSNINITNVRLEGDCPRIFNFVMDTKATGIVKDVYLNNWVLDGLTAHTDMDNELGGSRQRGRLSSWLINNMTIAEKCITRPSQANVKIDPKTTNNIKFSCG